MFTFREIGKHVSTKKVDTVKHMLHRTMQSNTDRRQSTYIFLTKKAKRNEVAKRIDKVDKVSSANICLKKSQAEEDTGLHVRTTVLMQNQSNLRKTPDVRLRRNAQSKHILSFCFLFPVAAPTP